LTISSPANLAKLDSDQGQSVVKLRNPCGGVWIFEKNARGEVWGILYMAMAERSNASTHTARQNENSGELENIVLIT